MNKNSSSLPSLSRDQHQKYFIYIKITFPTIASLRRILSSTRQPSLTSKYKDRVKEKLMKEK